MGSEDIRAKVFISCGQSRNTDEVNIAHKIAERLEALGFAHYIAVEEQTLKGIKENIFKQLETSEYLIFIDFKRERLELVGENVFRGSLFSHQELALASYLDIPILAFQESGVKKEDGLLRFLQGNSIEFVDRHLLSNVIGDVVTQRRWDPKWKNEIRLEREPKQYSDANITVIDKPARFFHIKAINHNPRKSAINCYAYLEKAINIKTKEEINLETVEFKWAGYTFPFANISPGSSRNIDAFYVMHDIPSQPLFNVFADSTHHIPKIYGPGEFGLTFSVISENFSPARLNCVFIIGNKLDEIQLV